MKTLLLSALLGLGITQSGAFASDFHSPRTAALGGAGHAGPLLNDALVLNPSFAAFLVNRTSASYAFTSFSGEPDTQGRTYQVGLIDGRSSLFQAGIAYTLREDGSILHVGAAKSIVQRTGLGLGMKFLFNPSRQKLGSDFTFSFTAAPFNDLQLALIVDNLAESDEGVIRGMNREFILGVKYNVLGIVLLYFDPHLVPTLATDQGYGYEGGLEFVMFRDLFLRMGAFRNSQVPWLSSRGRGYGTGFGWIAPKLSLDFGIERVVEPTSATAYSFGATLYL